MDDKQTRVCLAIIFNHRYDANIPKLRQLYGKRFHCIKFLVPFYDGEDPDVIPIYESSDVFQGYFAQALQHLKGPFSHVVFSADDLLLNNHLSESNILDALQLTDEMGYIKRLTPIAKKHGWCYTWSSVAAFRHRLTINYEQFIPTASEAADRIHRHGIDVEDVTWKTLLASTKRNPFELQRALYYILQQKLRGQLLTPYPLLMGYSDFVVIPSNALNQFAHLCGIFAAMGLFVEVACPTAMAICCKSIKTESMIPWEGVEFWDAEPQRNLETRCQGQIDNLYSTFSPNQLYMHPVKLSKWQL